MQESLVPINSDLEGRVSTISCPGLAASGGLPLNGEHENYDGRRQYRSLGGFEGHTPEHNHYSYANSYNWAARMGSGAGRPESTDRSSWSFASAVFSEGVGSFLGDPTPHSRSILSQTRSTNSSGSHSGRGTSEQADALARAADDANALTRPPPATTYAVIGAMLVGGACVNAAGSVLFALAPVDAHASAASALLDTAWISVGLTMGTFVGCAGFTLLDPANLAQLRARASPTFVWVLLVPSGLDVLVTGMAYSALLLVDPALVGILKTTIQVLVVAILGRVYLGKKLSWREFGALCMVLVGVAVVVLRALLFVNDGGASVGSAADTVAGLLIVAASGTLGGVRNIVEAALLQDDGLSGSALLLAESAFSSLLLLPLLAALALSLYAVPANQAAGAQAESNALAVLSLPGGAQWRWAECGLALLFVVSAYGKDAGKFYLVKWESALRAKMLALVFPVGTWVIDVCLFYGGGRRHHPTPLGVPWFGVASWVQLSGFAITIAANAYYLEQKTKKGK